jgi:hypothetical protein
MFEPRPQHASGFVCPRCGGALWEHPEREDSRFECRIGDSFSALELWVEHCDARNQAVKTAARALAENAGLARHLADWARHRGDDILARRLEDEAASEDAAYEQVRTLLDGLDETEDSATEGVGR